MADSLYFALGGSGSVNNLTVTGICTGCGSSGTVTSVGAGTIASVFTFSVATATTTPAISLSLSAQLANCILAGPTSGGNAAPTCRAMVASDLGSLITLPANGGTGQSTYTKGDMLASPGGAVLNKVPVGTDGFVWTADAASTNGVKWAAAGSAGANTALSNLASVAINTTLLPNGAGTLSLGNSGLYWASAFFKDAVRSLNFNSPSGAGLAGVNAIGYTDATGPFFYDDNANGGSGAKLTFNLQSLTANKAVIWPNLAGTVALTTNKLSVFASTTSAELAGVISNESGTGALLFGTAPTITDIVLAGHVVTSGSTPSASSCGSGPTVVGNDNAGRVTIGTGVTTTCTLTFAAAWTTAPVCHAENETTILLVQPVPTTTTLVLNSGSALTSNVIAYSCRGY